MAWVLGETVSESFYTGVTGETFTRTASYIAGSSVVWNPTFSEIGSGWYRYSYTISSSGTAGAYEWVGTGSGGSPISVNFDVEATGVTVVVSAATAGSLTQTLAQLRQRVARRLGDYEELTATSNGTTTTFIDAVNINSATESMVGRVLVTSTGTVHRITTQVDSTSTITFTPACASATLVETNDVVTIYNKRGKGFTPAQYKAAINDAINDAFPLGRIEVRGTISGTFDSDTPEITVPSSMTHVHTVEWSDDEGDWHVLMKSTRSNEQGWRADPTAGEIRLQGIAAQQADGYSVRLTGYGRQDVLSADSDTCALNAEYVIARACYHLTYGNIDRDEKYAQTTTGYEKESKALRMRLRRIERTDSELVRSA